MAEFKHRFSGAAPMVGTIGVVDPSINGEDGEFRGLRYSSPWPWILAGVTSLAMWASLAWLVWLILR